MDFDILWTMFGSLGKVIPIPFSESFCISKQERLNKLPYKKKKASKK